MAKKSAECSGTTIRKNKKGRRCAGCWDLCKLSLLDSSDYIKICMGDSFVTHEELVKMIGPLPQK